MTSAVFAVSPETIAGSLLLNCSENCSVPPHVQELSEVHIKIVRVGSQRHRSARDHKGTDPHERTRVEGVT